MKSPPVKPTDAEIPLLQVLWRQGPCTLKQLHEAVVPPAGYTTVQKLLQILMDKGLVRRDETQIKKKPLIYEAVYSEHLTMRHLVTGWAKVAFGGNRSKLVLQILSIYKPSSKDLDEILRELERQKKV